MATNNFNPDYFNNSINPLLGYVDGSGVTRMQADGIASYNFDGYVPFDTKFITASAIQPGMYVGITGSAVGDTYYRIVKTDNDDFDFEEDYTGITYLQYLDDNYVEQVVSVGASSTFSVRYEDWANRNIGLNGWQITNAGNAIFSNVAVRGEITATSGNVEEITIGSNDYNIINIIGLSSASTTTRLSGEFIMAVESDQKLLIPGDNIKISGTTASGYYMVDGSPSYSNPFNSDVPFIVLTASYNETVDGNPASRYFCRKQQSSPYSRFDYETITASGGTFNLGGMYFGSISSYSLSNADIIEGFTFRRLGVGSLWTSYIPDYIDVTGRFSLGGGDLYFDGSDLTVRNAIHAGSGEISGDLAIVEGGQIYVGNNKDSGQRINIRHTDLTGYTELGFPTFSLITGSATSASPLLQSGGFDDLTPGEDADPPWQSFYGFGGFGGGSMIARVDSTFYKDGGQSLKIAAGTDVPGGVSSVAQGVSLVPGEEYILSAWVYSDTTLKITDGNYVDIWLLSASFSGPDYFNSQVKISSIMGATEVSAGTWTKLSNKFVAPASPFAYYRIDLRQNLPTSASIWWDTIELTKSQTVSNISGLYFNDGELFSENISIRSDGTATFGFKTTASALGSNPDPTKISNVLSISGTNPSYKLWSGHIDPTKAGFSIDANSHIKTGQITSSATYAITTSTSYMGINSNGLFARYSSSQSIKDNIVAVRNELAETVDESKIISSDLTVNYKRILDLCPVEYDKLDEPGSRKFGFIAEDVAEKLPEIATYDNDGSPVYFDLAGLIAATLAVLQEQQETIEDLKSRMLQLESQLGG